MKNMQIAKFVRMRKIASGWSAAICALSTLINYFVATKKKYDWDVHNSSVYLF